MANAIFQSATDAPTFGSSPRGRSLSITAFPPRSKSFSVKNPAFHQTGLNEALAEARKSLDEGGMPIGTILVHHVQGIVGRGHSQRIQSDCVIHHAEMICLQNVGRKPASFYRDCTLYTTLSPCSMCSGAIIFYGIPSVVIGDNKTIRGAEDYLKQNGIEVENMNSDECESLMKNFIDTHPDIWQEDNPQLIVTVSQNRRKSTKTHL
ncbi:unnamed protein product [Didymodactylos carnosus]|uniref:Cytosine deaminase n=1 Tax=Didymodactylos carnosus TaxID=1234261 RepID=A0A813WM71_9BILA|nr:unnamed protein product [Didymodactylos carnosus]CAF0898037.1 unnamed protein product [Didymodactylos carnosus]CAF3645266.1 unnamed protein product [Didymodactylos carnosus]CAF3679213.1 unnamed protein product [Didymodactylos carnosus]